MVADGAGLSLITDETSAKLALSDQIKTIQVEFPDSYFLFILLVTLIRSTDNGINNNGGYFSQ